MKWLAQAVGLDAQDRFDALQGVWESSRLPRFSDILPYHHCDFDSLLYELPDGESTAVGFALEGMPKVGISEQIETTLQELSELLEPNVCLQVSLYADPDVRDLLARYCRLRPGSAGARSDGVFRRMARRRYSHLEALDGELTPYDFRLFFSVAASGGLDNPASVALARRIRDGMESMLGGCSIPTRRLAPADLVQLLGGLFNPRNPSRRRMDYSTLEPIADQCVLQDTVLEIEPGSIAVRGDGADHALAALTVSRYPALLRLAGMQGLLGDPLRSNLRYLGPFMITLCMQAVDQDAARTLVALKSARASTNASSPMARLMPSYYRRQLEDWQICGEVLDNGGGLALMSHHVLVQAPCDALAVAEERARAVWRSCGFTLAKCEFLQLQGLLATLPLSLTPALARDLRMFGLMSRKTTHNVVHSMPALAEWKGTRNPSLLFVGRRGQLMNLDIFDSPGNYNVVVAGSSGTGKSVLLNEIAASAMGTGGRVWIFDIGGSYLQASDYFKGQYLRFGASSSMSLNPFSAVADIMEDMRMLKPMFAQMIAPHSGLSDFQLARLEGAIMRTWERHGADGSPTELQRELLADSSDSRIHDMAVMLGPYTSDGVHGRWFNGPATVSFESDLLVLELEELKSNPELQSVVMLQLMFLVSQEMYATRNRRKLVVVDEAWDLLRGESVAEFIEHGYRRARKYNGSFLSATQSVADFHANPAGRAAYANSDWMMLLAQKDEEIDQLLKHGQLSLDQGERQLMSSVHTSPGRYAEVFVRCEGVASGVGRLIVDPYANLLYSSRAEDRLAVQRHIDRGLAIDSAIEAVIDERSAGANANPSAGAAAA